MNATSLPSQDERVMAALSHITILIPTIGVIAPIVIWVTQKDKSRYVAFQALQAAAFQLLIVLLWFVGMACYMGSFFLMVGGTTLTRGGGPGPVGIMMFIPFLFLIGMLLIMLLFIILGVVAAVMTFQGKDFRYPIIGDWIARYTQASGPSTGTTI